MKLPKLLKKIGKAADREDINAFVVGGFVRDAFLGIKDKDIDIVVEANAINFAKTLAEKWGVKPVLHEGFKTATIEEAGYRIDLATARREVYKKPAVLPSIRPATIKEDLFRRDFTINAMAISLNQPAFGRLADFFGGISDLKNKAIRVLHDQSFMDDPTRILRAIRLKERLGFKIDPHTEKLMRDAIRAGIFTMLKKQRLKKEIDLILDEPRSLNIISELKALELDIKFP
jgi:tRNA nucleotidyltransferase (CCA-adding enzyme)